MILTLEIDDVTDILRKSGIIQSYHEVDRVWRSTSGKLMISIIRKYEKG